MVIFIGGATFTKSAISCVFGLLLGAVGVDPLYGQPRLTFDQLRLFDGIDFIIVAMGLFAVSEVIVNAERSHQGSILKASFVGLFPSLADLAKCGFTIISGHVMVC